MGKSRKKKTPDTPERLDPWKAALHCIRHMVPFTDDPLRKQVGVMIRARDLPGLCSLGGFEDKEYHNPQDVRTAIVKRQISALFRKNTTLADEKSCKAEAWRNFLHAETVCSITNKRLDWFFAHPERMDTKLANYLSHMEQDIISLLGDIRPFLDSLDERIRVTSGATEDRTRKRSYPFLKVTGKVRAPKALHPLIECLLVQYDVNLEDCKFVDVQDDLIDFVPKNLETDRTIGKGPTHAIPAQLAFDEHAKSRLTRWGINLKSQGRNQEMALQGSIDGTIATVDLRQASDTLAFNAVAWTFPVPWFTFLDQCRSSGYRSEFGSGRYAKFSAMGNGATFTVETIIFAAACRAVGSRHHAVYGDDIAIGVEFVPELLRLLGFLGFKTNVAKTFHNRDSRFRESCGCDYYKGELITPFYLRSCPKLGHEADVSHVLNGLIAVGETNGPLWDYCIALARDLKLAFVPWNEDTRSGLMISTRAAYSSRKAFIYRGKNKKHDALRGFTCFHGYATAQSRRKTTGWRSLFLWHINKRRSYGLSPQLTEPKRLGSFLLALREQQGEDADGNSSVSAVSTRVAYRYDMVRYSPPKTTCPSYLYEFSEVLLG
jgi:hypothetical protein